MSVFLAVCALVSLGAYPESATSKAVFIARLVVSFLVTAAFVAGAVVLEWIDRC